MKKALVLSLLAVVGFAQDQIPDSTTQTTLPATPQLP